MSFDFHSLLNVLLALIPAFSPLVVAAVKSKVKVPNLLKPVLNAAVGAGVAYVTGQDPVLGVVAATVGKAVRDALDVSEPATK